MPAARAIDSVAGDPRPRVKNGALAAAPSAPSFLGRRAQLRARPSCCIIFSHAVDRAGVQVAAPRAVRDATIELRGFVRRQHTVRHAPRALRRREPAACPLERLYWALWPRLVFPAPPTADLTEFGSTFAYPKLTTS